MKLGDKVRDRVSGFEGTVVARTEFLNATTRLQVSSKVGVDGKLSEEWFDESRLAVTAEAE